MATATGEPTRLTVSLYLLRASKVSEALQQLEAASASSSTLIESIPEGKFLALPSDPSPPKWLDPISSLIPAGSNLQLESQSLGGILWVPRNVRKPDALDHRVHCNVTTRATST